MKTLTDLLMTCRPMAGAALLLALTGCGQPTADIETPPPAIGYTVLQPALVQELTELSGRVLALRSAEVRPQVGGILSRRLFEQGTDVRAGQPLFQIDTATFEADIRTATAAVQRAEAGLARSTTQAERLKPLAESEAVSRQVYEDARSQQAQAAAEVAQARAELARRQLDLKFATIVAPIQGRIDQAVVSEGALVSASDTTPLARIHQIDQVYVDVRQPAAELDRLKRAVDAARQAKAPLPITILSQSGEPLGLKARLLFSGVTIDEATGDVLVRLLVDNRESRLLPGMFVRARLTLAEHPQALTIPQEAVSRTGAKTRAWVVDDHGKVRSVEIGLGPRVERSHLVRTGLKRGDKVVVQGLDRMSEGAAVRPHEVGASAAPASTR